jgi:hypothetical protein
MQRGMDLSGLPSEAEQTRSHIRWTVSRGRVLEHLYSAAQDTILLGMARISLQLDLEQIRSQRLPTVLRGPGGHLHLRILRMVLAGTDRYGL